MAEKIPLDGKDRVVVVATIVLVLAGIMVAAFVPIETLAYLTNDDAYYYLQPALNIVQGKGITFDGINPTNGFHPLWMAVSVVLAYVASADHELLLRLVYIVLFMLLGSSIILYWLHVKRIAGVVGAIAAILCFLNPMVHIHMLNGLESGLLIFLIFLLLWASRKYRLLDLQIPVRRKIIVGFILGLMFLCRLDSAFILIGIVCVVCVSHRVKVWLPRYLYVLLRGYWPVCMAFILTVLPYFVWNITVNGHFFPLSGALKSSFPYPIGDIRRVVSVYWLPYSATIALPVVWAAVSLARKNGHLRIYMQSGTASMGAGIWLGLVLHFAYTALFTTWGVKYWTFASYIPIALVLIGVLCGRVLDSLKHKGIVAAAICTAILSASIILQVIAWFERANVHSVWHQTTTWVCENTREDAVFAMTDCGYFGYFSQRATVNLDGLINGYEYQAALTNGCLQEYLEKCGVDYIAALTVWDDGRTENPIKLHYDPRFIGRHQYLLFVMPVSDAIYVSEQYRQTPVTRPEKPPIKNLIWRYDPQQVRARR